VEPLAESPPAAPPAGTKSALAFLAALLALQPLALLAQQGSPAVGLVATELAVYLLPALIATAGSNLRLAPYLRLRRARPRLLMLGALVGGAGYLLAGAVMTLTQRLVPRSWVETFDLGRLFEGPSRERWALAAVAALAAPVCEEITFRGYLQTTLSLRRRPPLAIAAGALLFAALHLDPVRFPALLLLGAVFGWLTWRAGSVWPAVAAHAANNGIGAAILLARGAPEAFPPPDVSELVAPLGLGVAALGLLIASYRAAAPSPPPAWDAVVLVDPASPSISWRPGRVPPVLAAVAFAAAASLASLGLAGLMRAP
jgi:membrane protease YdiL (CAAX protease family)